MAGTVHLDQEQPTRSRVALAIEAGSIDTGNTRRDKHLRSEDFFDAARFPRIAFASRDVEAVAPAVGRYRVAGDLTMRGTTRPVVLDIAYDPPAEDGVRVARFFVTGVLDRRDFGITWNHPPLSDLADQVRLAVVVEATPGERGQDALPLH